MSGALATVCVRRIGVTFDGLFTTSSASSPVTSSTRTALSGGVLLWSGVVSDEGTPQYSKNGGAWADVVHEEGATIAVGDTLAFRATLSSTSDQAFFSMLNSDFGDAVELPFVTLTKL